MPAWLTGNAVCLWALYSALLLLTAKPLGTLPVQVFTGERTFLHPVLRPLEAGIYRLTRTDEEEEMGWSATCWPPRLQRRGPAADLPDRAHAAVARRFFNPQDFPNVPQVLAWNTAASFTTNTNWQNYGGEATMSYLTQMIGPGHAQLHLRGHRHRLGRRAGARPGAPLGQRHRLLLGRPGPLHALRPAAHLLRLRALPGLAGRAAELQRLHRGAYPRGRHADHRAGTGCDSQEAIKELGTNGGGFINANSAHPYENPTPLTNFVEMLSIFLIGSALVYMFGKWVGNTKQGWAHLGGHVRPVLAPATSPRSAPSRTATR